MKEKKQLQIEILLTEETQIYNTFNYNQLSEELSNYIYNQCKGTPSNADLILNINHNFEISDEEKTKLVDSIRENYGLDIKENLLKLKYEHIIEIFFIILGALLLITSNLFDCFQPIIGEVISIFGCVSIWEMAHNIFFVETKIRMQNKRLRKLTEAKINFNKIK